MIVCDTDDDLTFQTIEIRPCEFIWWCLNYCLGFISCMAKFVKLSCFSSLLDLLMCCRESVESAEFGENC